MAMDTVGRVSGSICVMPARRASYSRYLSSSADMLYHLRRWWRKSPVECQAGLEALNAGAEADDLAAGTSADTTLAVFRDGVDIRLPFFRDLLAEKPIPGADTIRSLAEWSVDGSVEGQKSTTVAGKKIWDGAAQKIKF
ncbi:hypothetical protein B0H10DRAFT_1963912 [Mycena sp. CBHHK59/15]|nr:hypothetical protein B0H10DRAFT_1963912 [Mycena sp. CBHHK59/15]